MSTRRVIHLGRSEGKAERLRILMRLARELGIPVTVVSPSDPPQPKRGTDEVNAIAPE